MIKFIDRKAELEFLEGKYRSKEAQLIVLYGRRRIGKTELLMKFCRNKKAAYFLGRLESREDTIKRFNNLLVETFNDSRLLTRPLTNWDNIFDYIGENAKGRLVIIFDEFPFIIERFPEIISVLQDKWDSKLRESKIVLILSGSSISMMEKHAINYQSPLYGRRTGQWKVDKLNLIHLGEFFPKYKAEELIILYSCLDCIPGYLVKFSTDKKVIENIREKILTKGEYLYEEIEILLREEFRDPSNYMSILSSVAGGTVTFNEIYNKTGLDKSLLSKYIYILENLGILEKIIPVTKSYKSKLKARGLYLLKDNFFDFWFRFVYPNKQELEKGNVDAITDYVQGEMSSYLGKKFEQFIIELLPRLKPNFTKIGRWWHKDMEIDVVALNEQTRQILFAECKWQDNVDAEAVLRGLKEKSAFVEWFNGKRKEYFMVFAKSFRKKMQGCFDLKDLEKPLKK